ncbi:alpha-(1,3)-fucosyltransferase C-like [Daphnia carinata]|uniref:alpha-(1,3)-fucosyltransferase C-like n=1 Tax=Daphnia carinata TaxID=120202 RepID=UPI00257A4A98|nr:alpha-(1,3)-fucosyltransferase C-like [Daphnia carinata]
MESECALDVSIVPCIIIVGSYNEKVGKQDSLTLDEGEKILWTLVLADPAELSPLLAYASLDWKNTMTRRTFTYCYLICIAVLFTAWVMVKSYKELPATHRWNLAFSSDILHSASAYSKQKADKGGDDYAQPDIQQRELSNKLLASNKNSTSGALKLILMWSTWMTTMADEPLVKARCPVTSCLFTSDMSLLRQSDVVVLYIDTLTDFPTNRQAHQRFVFAQLESPTNTKVDTINDPRLRYDYFNWTMTYRRDSDILLRDYYGSLVKMSNQTRTDKNNVSFIRTKTKLVAWFVAHCSTPIRREEYVRQLSQFVTVDVFGQCGKECPTNCDDMLRSDYKFYLAFENSWCPDYVTEKLIRPLVYDAVPIVLGGADYSRFAPPHSYINVRDFGSAKELADYLMLLDKSDDLYARYFDWKRDYDVNLLDLSGWCDLCRMAHDDSLPHKTYRDIKQWWMEDGGECETNSTKYY